MTRAKDDERGWSFLRPRAWSWWTSSTALASSSADALRGKARDTAAPHLLVMTREPPDPAHRRP